MTTLNKLFMPTPGIMWLSSHHRGRRGISNRYIEKIMKILAILFIFSFLNSAWADKSDSAPISPGFCKEGVNKQPDGPFALYIFCDDALAANVAVFLIDMHNPIHGPYQLTKRFWQNEEWSADVSNLLWLSDKKHLILSTSPIYGTGEIYKLNLGDQKFESIYRFKKRDDVCPTSMHEMGKGILKIKVSDCGSGDEEIEISI